MNTQLLSKCALCAVVVVATVASTQLRADVTSDCVGKVYGTAGCPVFSSSASSLRWCGNSVVDAGEECDNGFSNGTTNCDTSCNLLTCGDGIVSVQIGEECEPRSQNIYARGDAGTLKMVTDFIEPMCGAICSLPVCDDQGRCEGGCKRKFVTNCATSQRSSVALTITSSSSLSSVSVSSAQSSSASSISEMTVSSVPEASSVFSSSDASSVSSSVGDANFVVPVVSCGDSIVQSDEECDAGIMNSNLPNARCRTHCVLPTCGDGVIDPILGEQCDDGVENKNDVSAHCSLSCKRSTCGDGQLDEGEECDEGQANADTLAAPCSLRCTKPYCGDGVIQAEEQCDDGSRNSATRPNACRTDCAAPRCGDGIVDTGEQCDHGVKNGSTADLCDSSCKRNMLPPVMLTTSISNDTPLAVALATFGALSVIAFMIHMMVRGTSKMTKNPDKILDEQIPLDELEMPWHRWQ